MNRASSRIAAAKSHPTWTLVACVLASSLSFVEGSVLSVALPAIRASYGADALRSSRGEQDGQAWSQGADQRRNSENAGADN